MSQPHFEGREFLVNTVTESNQSAIVFTRLASGGFVAAWNGSVLWAGTTYHPNVKFQIYSSTGTRVGNEFDVTGAANFHSFGTPSLAPLSDGGFVVVLRQSASNGNRLLAEFYTATGQLVREDVEVHDRDTNFKQDPQAALLAGGNLVVAYTEQQNVPAYQEVNARLLTQQGDQVGSVIPVNTAEPGDQIEPSIAALASGGFVVTWTDYGSDGDATTSTVKAQLFNASGAAVGGELVVDSAETGGQKNSSVAALASGGFVVVWQDTSTAAQTGTDVRGQIFDAAGNKVGGEFTVPSTVADEQNLPVVVGTESGGFIVSWSDRSGVGGDNSGYGVKARLFDSTGAGIGDEFLLNTFHHSDQFQSSLTALGGGRYVAGWTDYSTTSADQSGSAVRARIFEILRGTSDNDVVTGGADNDTFRFQDGGVDSASGGAGDDTFYYGRTFDRLDRVDGGPGTDTLVLQGDYLPLVFDEASLTSIEIVSLLSGSVTTWGQSGNFLYDYNLVMAEGNVAPGQQLMIDAQTLLPSEDLTFNGSAETDGGRFVIQGGQGNDSATGGAGDDTMLFQRGGVDLGFGGGGNDTFYYGRSFDTLDRVDGGEGTDTLVLQGDYLPLVFDGTRLTTIEEISLLSGSVTSWGQSGNFLYDYNVVIAEGNVAPGQQLLINGQSLLPGEDLTFDGSAETDGGRFIIHGGQGSDRLTGGSGSDILDGGAGADILAGGAGDDVHFIDNEGDVIIERSGEGIDEVRVTLAVASILGSNFENLTANSEISHDFRGSSANNVIRGASARDVIRLQDGGNDVAIAGEGNDTIYFGAAFTALDTVDGGGGVDAIILQGDYSAGLTLGTGSTSSFSGVESISLAPGHFTDWGDTAGNFYDYNLTAIDANVPAGGILRINGHHLRSGEDFTFEGALEADGRFFVFGGLGVDRVTGGSGNDIFVFGHDGRFGATDVVHGGLGYDSLYLRGDYDLNFTLGGFGIFTGIESLTLGWASDTQFVVGGDGEFDYRIVWDDAMLADDARITVNGSGLAAGETMAFDASDEAGGDFRLFGGAANDTIVGGGGDDLIYGGLGADTLRGNGGADTYRYHETAESVVGGIDTVQGFTHGVDLIDLSIIDANLNADGDQAFSFIGSAPFTAAGQLRSFQTDAATNTWRIEGDTDGNGSVDFMVQVIVDPLQSLTASDFIL